MGGWRTGGEGCAIDRKSMYIDYYFWLQGYYFLFIIVSVALSMRLLYYGDAFVHERLAIHE